MTDDPLIYTSKGNLPIASLEYRYAWDDAPGALKFSEIYTLNGEVVKQSAHVYIKQGAQTTPETGAF